MKCIYLKQKLNRKVVCKLDESKVIPIDCVNCTFKKIKCTIYSKNCANNLQIKKSPPLTGLSRKKPDFIKKKSNKLAKLERNRESLFTDDMTKCIICGKCPINKHEIFGGRNRQNSIKYKLVIPLCTCEHHDQVNQRGIHFDKNLKKEWHKKGQVMFNKTYPDLDFEDIFKRNYL